MEPLKLPADFKSDYKYFYDSKFIYAKKGEELYKLALFTDRFYKLRIINGIPILEIDGLRMQPTRDFKNPLGYAKKVISTLEITSADSVLDTCMGLGYTAIEASKTAKTVTTCEFSEAVIKLAEWNPWSSKLFDPKKIKILKGDSSELIKSFPEESFSLIIHDPPRFSHAPQLYSPDFYSELFRISKEKSRLFHYVGSLGGKSGRRFELEIRDRLQNAGFKNFRYKDRLQGILFEKS